MQIITTTSTASQTLNIKLGDQYCMINLYQKSTGLYLDLYVNNAPIVTGVLCRDRVKLVRQTYLGFIGDLTFFDTEGFTDPDYTGLNSRFELAYMELSDL